MKLADFPRLWDDACEMVRSDRELLFTVAAATLFLPSLVFSWLNAGLGEATWVLAFVFAALNLFVTYLGQTVILRLFLAHGGTIGFLLRDSVALVLPMIATVVLVSLGVAGGMILFIVPGIYLAGRLALASSLVADRRLPAVLALRLSWEKTGKSGFPLGVMIVGLGVALLATLFVLASFAGAVFGGNTDTAAKASLATGFWGLGKWAFELTLGVGATIGSVYMNAFYVAIYRRFATDASTADAGSAGV